MGEFTVQGIPDTARWIAHYRAEETARRDALFKDPYAKALAGSRGQEISESLDRFNWIAWTCVVRTRILDDLIEKAISQDHVDTVLNLACGLDTRPYRMNLPASVRWIEVDLPQIIQFKQTVFRQSFKADRPRCQLEQISLNLTDLEERRKLFQRIGQESKRTLVITEGLTVYLSRDENRKLAEDLQTQSSFQDWLMDIYAFPSGLNSIVDLTGKLKAGDAELKFMPAEGGRFFLSSGWEEIELHPYLETGRRFHRTPWLERFFNPVTRHLPQFLQKKINRMMGIVHLRRFSTT